jgi:hypothetical protein
VGANAVRITVIWGCRTAKAGGAGAVEDNIRLFVPREHPGHVFRTLSFLFASLTSFRQNTLQAPWRRRAFINFF